MSLFSGIYFDNPTNIFKYNLVLFIIGRPVDATYLIFSKTHYPKKIFFTAYVVVIQIFLF